MAEMKGITVPVTPEIQLPILASSAPREAQILEGKVPHIRHTVAVTEEHGLQIIAIDDHDTLPHPYRASGQRQVADLDSMLDELSRRPLPETTGTLWGTAESGILTAIYNDHGAPTAGNAGWRDDRLILKLVKDDDWARWHALSGQYKRQSDFGDAIEELLHTIKQPDQADLLEIIDSIRASTAGEFEQSIERSNGGQKLTYKQEHTVKAGRAGQLEVPQIITLSLRPWDNHPTEYDVPAYFRVRIQDGMLSLAVKLKPTRQIIRQAWDEVCTTVHGHTGKPVYATT